jgi:cytoskeletal protein CcmA (bactofilin family)
MFKDNPNKSGKNAETIIGQSVKVEGDFIGEGDVIVEGIVVGNLRTKNHLTVGSEAKIQAEIGAQSAFVAGEIIGNVKIDDYLELTATASIAGDVSAGLISIERGAKINGKVNIGGEIMPKVNKKVVIKEPEEETDNAQF